MKKSDLRDQFRSIKYYLNSADLASALKAIEHLELILNLDEKTLTTREKEVQEILLTGITIKDISEKLFITEQTVKFHLSNIYRKNEVRGRSELAAKLFKGN